jgi:hypothetical protein
MNADWDKRFVFAEVQGGLLAAIAETQRSTFGRHHALAGSIWQWIEDMGSHSNWCAWSKPIPMPSLMSAMDLERCN